jgi:hypothetical protein
MAAGAAIGVLTFLAFSPLVRAQDFSEERIEISPYVGATKYHRSTNGIGSHFDAGVLFGGRVTENLTQHFALEESFGYNPNSLRILGAFPGSSILMPKFDNRTFNFNGDAVYNFTPLGSRFRPFLDIGVGGVRFLPTQSAKNFYLQNFASPVYPALTSVSRVQYNMGGGLKVRLTNWFGLRGDLRFVLSRYPTYSIDIPQGQWLEGTEMTGGLVFYIGGGPNTSKTHKIETSPVVAAPSTGNAGLTASNPAGPDTGFRLTENARDTLGHNLNYHWSVNGAPVGENASTIMYTPAQPGQYKVEVQVSDAVLKNPAPSASPEPVTLYISEHRLTVGPINIAPLQGTAGLTANNPAADGSGFRFSVNAQDSLGHPLTYRWTVDGATIPGNTNSVTFTEAQPGTHTVNVTVTDGTLSASANGANFYTVARPRPTATCTATPAAVTAPAQVVLSVGTTVAPGSSTRINWTVSEGTLAAPTSAQTTFDSSTVTFPPGGQAQTKTITATATVNDDFGGSASCNTTIRVTSNPQTTHYGDILFGEGSARVNNYAKRILLERLYPDLTSGIYRGYTVVLVGHVDPSERTRTLDRQRVLDAAAVLTATKGPSGKNNCADLKPSDFTVDWVGTTVTDVQDISIQPVPQERAPDRVNADDPRAKNRRVEIWVVPPGKSVPTPPVREAHQLPLPELRRLGCPQ